MKTVEERLLECLNIRIQLRNLGIEAAYGDHLRGLYDLMSKYTRDGTAASGKLPVPAAEFHAIEYHFTPTPGRESFCNVKKRL